MEPTNQTPIEDKEFDAIKAKIPFDEDDKKKVEPVVTPKAPAPKDEPKEPVKPTPVVKTEEKDEEPIVPRTPRPEKYIPINQYTSEKSQWKETVAEKDKRIAELQTIADSKPNTKKNDDLIKAYQDKYDVDEETAKAEIDRVRFLTEFGKEETVPKQPESKPVAELTPEQQAKIEKADMIEAQSLYEQEFKKDAIPQLISLFPNATPAQLESAKAEMEKLATTEKYLDKSLDYIAFKEKDTLSGLFAGERKGPESARTPIKGKVELTSSDFDNGKTPFNELDNLSPEEADKIVRNFSIKTWDRYSHYKSQQEEIRIS
jgi:hypothetical protein